MKKFDKKTILAILLLFLAISLLIFSRIDNFKLDIELKSYEINVNLYDTIDLNSYISKVSDNRGNNLLDSVKIIPDIDEEDILDGNNLTIVSLGPKVIEYTIEKKGKKTTEQLIIKVITDPYDSNYSPNKEVDESIQKINEDDIPTSGDYNQDFSDEQLEYLNNL